ncbi:Dyp-type peroxidase [Aliamphritea spongicola]|uniref:Dyp-type peroxidase n=1 Tax=Aliamphritea spongicola TaxID=707589 RepID=UPI00196A5779|nr:Dyp-type peroxidase [Aliamphritea spongicola]MBN3563370.1 Dyp-type peroxidase [Aliamphritea spongicola]
MTETSAAQALCQSGVIAEANSDALFITYDLSPEADVSRLKHLLAQVPVLTRAMEDTSSQSGAGAELHVTVAVGEQVWDQFDATQRPAELLPFPQQQRDQLSAPATPADLLLHIRSNRHDINHEMASRLHALLAEHVVLVEQVHGFRYLDSRDMTGFVDGTENPQGDDRAAVAVIADGAFAGGSYIHLQRYEHDLQRWSQLAVKQQEDIIGRTKTDNVEYAGADKASFAHTKRTSLKDTQGKSVEILRHSMPYGDLTKRGLLFASFGASAVPFTQMLESMFHGEEQGGAYDKLLDYTVAVTGQSFFAPGLTMLESWKDA